MDRLEGRVALVTGAAAGVGAALVERLLSYGLKVVGCDINVPKLQELSARLQGSKGTLLTLKCDLQNEDEILGMFAEIKKQYGGVDVCVNNAGLGLISSLCDGDTEKWRTMLNVNVLALSICTREAIKSMRERGVDDGHILHMCSMSGHVVTPGHDSPFYIASKHAVKALTDGLRNELMEIDSGIRISSLSPGLINTDFSISMKGEEGRKYYEDRRCMTAPDIVDGMIYALSAPPHVQVHDIIIYPWKKLKQSGLQ